MTSVSFRFPARQLAVLLASTLALSACAYAMPNPTPPYSMGHLGPGDPTVNRIGGPDGLAFKLPNPRYYNPS